MPVSSKYVAVAVLLFAAFITSALAQSSDPDFTIVVFPDTQYYSASHPQIFTAETNWVVSQKAARNIVAVIGVGDIVNGGGDTTQWLNADTSVKVLEGKVPYFLPIGNHDYNKNDPQNRTASATNFNKYFGPSRYANSHSGWQGSYPSGSNENFYSFLTINGKQYLILCLEFYPRAAAVNWAAGVIAANPDKEVIISLHGYGYFDNTRVALCDKYNAEYYGMGADYDGEDLFYGLIRKYKNISMVLSGHIVTGVLGQGAAGHRTDMGVNGNVINQIMANYQDVTNGGNGFIRIMTFRPSLNRIDVTTYSPYTGGSMTDAANQFSVPWHADGSLVGNGSLAGTVKNASTCATVSGAKVSYAGGSVTSNSSGKFTLSNITPSDYTFTTQATGFGTTAKTIQIDPTLQESWKIFLGSTSNIGTITGKVTNNGSPVNNATVSYDGASTNTIADGTYTLTNVPAGSVQLTAAATGMNSSSATITVTSGVTSTQNFALTSAVSGTTVSGHVKDATTGSGISGATVSVGTLQTTTAADGSYALQNVPTGPVTLTAAAAGYATAQMNANLTAGQSAVEDFVLNAVTPGAITGQVTNAADGTPIVGAQVAYNNTTGIATTDASGNYVLNGVTPGAYTLTVTATGFLSTTASVTVTSGVTTTQSFTLNAPPAVGTIAGRVTDASGTAIGGATVTSGSLSATADATGTYSLANVPVGTAVQVTAAANGFASQTQAVAVTEGQTAQLNFALVASTPPPPPATTPGTVTGKITNLATGGAISGATVSYSGGSTTTNSSGLYTVTGVAPGTYTFTATHSGYLTRTSSVTVASGATATNNMQLSTAGKISGSVKNSSGGAISGAVVTITGGNIATTVSLTTSSSGTYATTWIPIGSYKVTVAKSGYTTQSKSTTVVSGATASVSFTMK